MAALCVLSERFGMKIAIYGGTFNPIHHGHLILAREALEKLQLDKVIFVPASISPFKKTAAAASGELRLAMLRVAIEGETEFAADDCELRRPGPSYTIDTVQEIARQNAGAEIYCLIGEDNVDGLTKWHRFRDLEKLVRFVVLDRTGQLASHAYPVIRRKIDISATEIRKRVACGQSIRYFVPEAVEEIIRRTKIYKEQAK
jgi:nicotinate-nucleotide adenylyltransferase